LNLGLKEQYTEGVNKLGFNMEDLLEQERDAALGNGGLGRLAACYLDSSASQELPVWGYGLRYKYGIFQQVTSLLPSIFFAIFRFLPIFWVAVFLSSLSTGVQKC
jgi:glucan phosphorylase